MGLGTSATGAVGGAGGAMAAASAAAAAALAADTRFRGASFGSGLAFVVFDGTESLLSMKSPLCGLLLIVRLDQAIRKKMMTWKDSRMTDSSLSTRLCE